MYEAYAKLAYENRLMADNDKQQALNCARFVVLAYLDGINALSVWKDGTLWVGVAQNETYQQHKQKIEIWFKHQFKAELEEK